MDRLEAMSVFLAAVASGSLSGASRELGMPLATVSRKVAELEEHLNASLMTRSVRGLELTPAGRTYAAGAKAILEQLTEVERTTAGEYIEPKGDLVVSAPIVFGRMHVLPVVTRFLDAYPDVAVNLALTDRVAHFLDDQVDVALRVGSLPDSDLVATRLGTVQHIVCASPAYLKSHGTPTRPDDLARHRIIAFQSVSALSTWDFLADGMQTVSTPAARLTVSTIDAAIDAALDGAGLIRAVSYQVAGHVGDGRLVRVLREFEPEPRPVHLVFGRQTRLPLKLRAFIDFSVPRLRARLAEVRSAFIDTGPAAPAAGPLADPPAAPSADPPARV